MLQRIEYLDVAKLIGLALVCFCHIPTQTGIFHIWVYSFHMPLFFLLSGMFFKPKNFSIKRVVIQLLIPFILFNVLAILIPVLINLVLYRTFNFPKLHFEQWLMGEYVIGPSWFLLSLFSIRISCGYIYKYGKTRSLLIATIMLLVVFMLTENSSVWNVLNLGSTVLGLPFYVIGFMAKEFIIKYQ